jgi:hypothetical protein
MRALRIVLQRARNQATQDPVSERNIELGAVERGDTKSEAREKIEKLFADLVFIAEHLQILHLTATFEAICQRHIPNIIGEARTSVRGKEGSAWKESLVQEKGQFEGLGGISKLLRLGGKDDVLYRRIKSSRDSFAHGQIWREHPTIDPEDTLALLLDLIEHLRSP